MKQSCFALEEVMRSNPELTEIQAKELICTDIAELASVMSPDVQLQCESIISRIPEHQSDQYPGWAELEILIEGKVNHKLILYRDRSCFAYQNCGENHDDRR